jgi:hypothetical protein
VIDANKKARDADRDAAIEVVEGAFADGQITGPDRDLRVERLLQAGTVGEVQMLVRALQPGVSRLAALAPQPPASPSGRGLRKVVVIVAVVFAIFTVLSVVFPLLVINSIDTFESSGTSGTSGEELELLTAEGYDGLVAAVAEKTGSATVFGATIYPGYAVVDVPVDARSQRSFGYYYDGGWSDWTGSGTAPGDRLELDQIDGATVEGLVREVEQLVQDPAASYVIVNARGGEDGVCLSAYAMNEYDETAYLDATCSGKVVRTYVS